MAAAGKTADVRPPTSQPYGGFIASSLDLFAAFHAAGLFLVSGVPTRLYEVYPAAMWTRLARRLPNKRRRDGREARAALLETLGVRVPEALSATISSMRAQQHCSVRQLTGASTTSAS
jgi:Protein of unknown function (DUF429)